MAHLPMGFHWSDAYEYGKKKYNRGTTLKKVLRGGISNMMWLAIVIAYFFISFVFGGWSYTWLIFIFGAFAGKIIDIFFGD